MIQNNQLLWRLKVVNDVGGYRIRQEDPLFPLYDDYYSLMIDESESTVILSAPINKKRTVIFHTSKRVHEAHT